MNEEQYRELQERVHVLRELANTSGWLYLTDLANDRLLSHRGRLRRGLLETLEEYKYIAGFVQGAEFILGLPEGAEKLLQEAEQQIAESRVAAQMERDGE